MFPAYGDSPYTFAQREFSRAFKEVRSQIVCLTKSVLNMHVILCVVSQRQVQVWAVLPIYLRLHLRPDGQLRGRSIRPLRLRQRSLHLRDLQPGIGSSGRNDCLPFYLYAFSCGSKFARFINWITNLPICVSRRSCQMQIWGGDGRGRWTM